MNRSQMLGRATPRWPWLVSVFAISLTTVASAATKSFAPAHLLAVPRVSGPTELRADLAARPWSEAAVVTGLIDLKSRAIARQATWFHLAYDDSALLVAARCEGEGVATTQPAITERDGRVWADDSVEILLVPPSAGDTWFQLVINAAGTIFDAKGKDSSWNVEADVLTARTPQGWVLAARIPFKSLGTETPRPGTTWRANFCRSATGGERTSWSPAPKGFASPSGFGQVVFADAGTGSARIDRVEPLAIGRNVIRLQQAEGLRFKVRELDGWHRELNTREGAADTLGDAFFLKSDATRRVELVLTDAKGGLLSRTWYPVESRQVTQRLAPVQARYKESRAGLERFPEAARAEAERVLDEAGPLLDRAGAIVAQQDKYNLASWQELERLVGEAERKLSAAWVYARTLEFAPKARFGVGFESPMRKVMIQDFPFEGRVERQYPLALAKNENEAAQVVVVPFSKALSGVSVAAGSPRPAQGAARFDGRVTVALVGHVKTGDGTPYEVDYRGWYPDPLLDFQKTCDAKPGEQVAFWVDVATTPKTPAGEYVVPISVRAQECPEVRLELRVQVWDFELPPGTHLRNAFTWNWHQVGPFYKERWTDAMQRKYREFIMARRLNIDHLYRKDLPDPRELKEYASRGLLNAFNLKYVGKGTTPQGLAELLDPYMPRLRDLGLFDMAYLYGFDEDPGEGHGAMRTLFEAMRKRYPGLKTMTTAYDNSFGQKTGLREAVDIWVPLTDQYDLEEARKLRAEGKDMWWYICLNPHHPYANWFIEHPAIEARLLLGAMSYKYEVGGFLYYLMAGWQGNHSPIDSGPYTKWNPGSCDDRRGRVANGDGSLLCPGPDGPLSTIRLENIRDGLEDYEYLYLLADLSRQLRSKSQGAQADPLLKKVDALLSVPDTLIQSLTEYTRDPGSMAAYRAELAACIVEARRMLGPSRAAAAR